MNILTMLSLVVWLFSYTSQDSTRSSSYYPIQSNSDAPRFSFKYEKPLMFIQDESDRTWFFHKNEIWILDEDLNWTYYGSIEFDEIDIVGSYNPYYKEFWFWSRDVGKVYTWKPGMSAPIRIDKSDHHRTQFGHYGFINPQNGNIYAFGGTGFWQDRSYIVEFDSKTLEWNIIPINNYDNHPEGRRHASGMYNHIAKELHILGGYGHLYERYDKGTDLIFFDDYWIFNFNDGLWYEKPIYGRNDQIADQNFVPETHFISTVGYDSINELAWHWVPEQTSQKLRLLVYDIRRQFATYLSNTIAIKNLLYIRYDQTNNRLIIHEIDVLNNQLDAEIKLHAYHLPDPDETRRLMDSIRGNELRNPIITYVITTIIVIVCIIGLVIISRNIFRLKNESKKIKSGSSPILPHLNESKKPDTTLFILLDESIQIWLDGREISSEFKIIEREIFVWLSWKHNMGNTFQSSTTIEDLFWGSTPNAEYVRKQRNQVLKHLDALLITLFESFTNSGSILVSRNNYNDKRKKEYGLDLDSITYSIELKPNFLLQKKSWIQNISFDLKK